MNKICCVVTAVLVCLGSGILWAYPSQNFADRVTYAVGEFPVGIAAADFNGDGRMDIAASNREDDTVSVYYGALGGGFTGRTDYTVGDYPGRLLAVDLDDSGRTDLVVAHNRWSRLTVLYARDTGGFNRENVAAGSSSVGLASADLDGDGRLDLAVTNFYGDHTVSVLYGQPDGSLGGRVSYATGSNPDSVAIADFDADDLPDLAVTSPGDHILSVFYGQAPGGFGGRTDYDTEKGPRTLVTGDFDDDGRPDLAMTHYYGDILVTYAQADGTLGENEIVSLPNYGYGLAMADFDMDGYEDLAATHLADDNTLHLFYGQAGGGFVVGPIYEIGRAYQIVAEDLNGDGLPDLVAANYWTDTVSVLYNTVPEPATMLLLSSGALGMFGFIRRPRRNSQHP